jgi:hypothetical protein
MSKEVIIIIWPKTTMLIFFSDEKLCAAVLFNFCFGNLRQITRSESDQSEQPNFGSPTSLTESNQISKTRECGSAFGDFEVNPIVPFSGILSIARDNDPPI